MTDTRYSVKVYSLRVREGLSPPGSEVNSPADAQALCRAYFDSVRDDREHFVALALKSDNTLIGLTELSVGGASGAIIDPKVLFRTLLVMGATRFILAHNHPSGNPTPSRDDLALTRRLRDAGKLLELECLDHLILGDGTGAVVSFAATGRLA